jgi:hypothetical protein
MPTWWPSWQPKALKVLTNGLLSEPVFALDTLLATALAAATWALRRLAGPLSLLDAKLQTSI